MTPDTRWTRRAVALLTQNDVHTALADYGIDHMTLLDVAIAASLKDPRRPLPGDLYWDEYFAGMIELAEKQHGPLDAQAPPAAIGLPAPRRQPQAEPGADTMTVADSDEGWRPRLPGRRARRD